MASAPHYAVSASFTLIFLAVLGVAIYTQISSATLSLPISPVLTVLVLLLPALAVPNAILIALRRRSTALQRTKPPNQQRKTLISHPVLLQGLQGILTIALATLLAANLVPSSAIPCVLNDVWQRFYSAHDGEAIRRIQDTLACCGFQSVKDRAWPFPAPGSSSTCGEAFGRQRACRDVWTAALQRNAGAGFAVVVLVGLFQVATLVLDGSWTAGWWTPGFARPQGPDVTRPLLASDAHVDEVEDGDPEDDARRRGYDGARENHGPRVEPSAFHGGRNEWSAE